jgi:hypothetical protein
MIINGFNVWVSPPMAQWFKTPCSRYYGYWGWVSYIRILNTIINGYCIIGLSFLKHHYGYYMIWSQFITGVLKMGSRSFKHGLGMHSSSRWGWSGRQWSSAQQVPKWRARTTIGQHASRNFRLMQRHHWSSDCQQISQHPTVRREMNKIWAKTCWMFWSVHILKIDHVRVYFFSYTIPWPSPFFHQISRSMINDEMSGFFWHWIYPPAVKIVAEHGPLKMVI